MSTDNRPAWMRNAQAFEDLAEQAFPASTVPAAPAPALPPAAVASLSPLANAQGGREVHLVDAERRYRVLSAPGKARVAVGAIDVSGASAKSVSLRLPAALIERVTNKTLGQVSAGVTALLVHALDRLASEQLNLVWDQGEDWRTEPGSGQVETGAREISGASAQKLAQRYPGALLTLIDARRIGPRPATVAALLTFALDDIDARGLELSLRVERVSTRHVTA